ncbi:hypothetical protein [Plantactinospora sp. KBS50]|uniref:hypothetical protein n=1 Tax=Plantactinospora sp. KBS50 TaxID=2024580 RepID=UPI000BAB0BC8|nr:hypothetical protein [Plantactinospora sp. KBS50]ASW53828.1 hypothetical protein CIK06_05960 [Plantactinospora sp. KBS50]
MTRTIPVIPCPSCAADPAPGVGAGSCPPCGGRGRRRAQLVLTVANADTGAVRSLSVEPGDLAARPDPAGGWRVDLTDRIQELAGAVGVAGTPDELVLHLPAGWRPDLPAARRYGGAARAIAECWREPWRVAIGRSAALVRDPARRLGRIGQLAGPPGVPAGGPNPLSPAAFVRLARGLDLALVVTIRDGVPVPAPVGAPGGLRPRVAWPPGRGPGGAVLRWPDGPRWQLRLLPLAAPVPADEFPADPSAAAAAGALVEQLDIALADAVPADPEVAIPAPRAEPAALPDDPVPDLARLAARHSGRAVTVRFTRTGCELYLPAVSRVRWLARADDLPSLVITDLG